VLQFSHPTICIVLSAHHQIGLCVCVCVTSLYLIIIHFNDPYRNSNQESLVPLNLNNQRDEIYFFAPQPLRQSPSHIGHQNILDNNSHSCGPRNSNYTKMKYLYTCVQMYIQNPSKSTKCCGYSSCMASS